MNTRSLQPQRVWNHFEDLNAVPRPSKQEAKIRSFMVAFAQTLGLEVQQDAIGNVIIKKPASEGMEDRATVILQTHLDMVHQKNAATDFDFSTQGIRSFVDGDRVGAKGTTLGADNGIGVAAAMSVLSSDTLVHPAIEALFTVDEESGMTGAKELDSTLLKGEILLNLDTEDDDEFAVGCAGGIDTNTHYRYPVEAVHPHRETAFSIVLGGLQGGHSGMDIHLGRANANLAMNELLAQCATVTPLKILRIDGGSLRNAIPRESRAEIVLPEHDRAAFEERFKETAEALRTAYASTDPSFSLSLAPLPIASTDTAMPHSTVKKLLHTLAHLPNGVWKMSPAVDGLVETSSSLARVTVHNGTWATQSLQRSMTESGKQAIARAVKAHFEAMGATVVQQGDYPGWEPRLDTRILAVAKQKYRQLFGDTPKVAACHAGLECGILGKHLPQCEMISFGPTIRNPHSPDESVSVSSVQKFWHFLQELLKAIPEKQTH